jgi:Rv0078B-related antitoxin
VSRDTENTLSDTSPWASEAYFRRLAEMTPSERVDIGVALWVAGDCLQRAAMRREHPEADDDEINFQIARRRYGEELARKAYRR